MDIIDWGAVSWINVIILTAMVFIAALIASFINMIFDSNFITGALITAILFCVVYIGWTHYPHGIDVGQEMHTPAAADPATPDPATPDPATPDPAGN